MSEYPDSTVTPRKLAEDHIDWFLRAIRPLLIDNFVHGYKHGKEDRSVNSGVYDLK